ncbi:MAG: IS66 family transposase [Burkholderiales bacterium]|nr:IS66 family transposase [Burkholderiales bacterium]
MHLHISGKYACVCCQTILAAAMPARVIDKGIPAAGLLAQVIVAKFDDHLPLFRQEEIYQRSGVFIPRSSMGGWVGQCGVRLLPLVQAMTKHLLAQGVLHGDETPVKSLQPGLGKTHQAYVWAWRTSDLCTTDKAVIYDFAKSRSGENARRMGETAVAPSYESMKADDIRNQLKPTAPSAAFYFQYVKWAGNSLHLPRLARSNKGFILSTSRTTSFSPRSKNTARIAVFRMRVDSTHPCCLPPKDFAGAEYHSATFRSRVHALPPTLLPCSNSWPRWISTTSGSASKVAVSISFINTSLASLTASKMPTIS